MIRLPLPVQYMLSLRGLGTRPWRTLLTLLGVTLGVAVVLAVEVTNNSTMDSIERIFNRATGQAELLVVPFEEDELLDGSLLTRVQRTEGIQIAAPILRLQTALLSEIEDTTTIWGAEGVTVGRSFEINGIDPNLDPQVRVYNLVEGRLPETGRYETVLPQKYAQEKKLTLGQNLEIVTLTGAEKLEIVGLLADDGAGLLNSGAVAFVPLEIVQDMFVLGDQFSEITVQVTPGIGRDVEALSELKAVLSERLGDSAEVTYPSARSDLVPRMLSSYQLGLFLFSIIAIFTGAFLIYNTFSMTVVERTQEIGMLRAIGMGRSQILSMVLAEALLLGILGSILGAGAGYVLARNLTRLVGGFLTVEQGLLTISTQTLLISFSVGIGVTLVAALFPAYKAAGIPPLEALRVRSRSGKPVSPIVWISGLLLLPLGWIAIYKISWPQPIRLSAGITGFFVFLLGVVLTVPMAISVLERIVRPIVKLVYRNEGALGSSNVRRSVLRTTMTVASLMISLIMIIGVGSIAQIITKDMQSWVDNALGGDLLVTSEEPLRTTFVEKLTDLPGVKVVSPIHISEVRVGSNRFGTTYLGKDRREKLYLFAIEPKLYRQITNKEFISGQGSPEDNWEVLEQGGALFISSIVAEEFEIGQGDTLSLITRRGEHDFIVAGVTTEFTRQGYIVTGTFDDLERWFGMSGANQFVIKINSDTQVDALAAEITNRYQERYNLNVQTTQTYRQNVLGLFSEATGLFEVLSLVGVIIGALGVLNTMSMNVLERQREIGGLRSVGMLRGQVVRMILAEAFTLGAIGAIYGMTFGNTISRIFLHAINMISGYELNYFFSLRPYVISLLVAFVISELAALSPASKAARVNIIEALKHE